MFHPYALCVADDGSLTPAVLQEALAADAAVVVAYHPPIFGKLTRLTLGVPLQRTLLEAAAHGISGPPSPPSPPRPL
jgi:hypothetical protein